MDSDGEWGKMMPFRKVGLMNHALYLFCILAYFHRFQRVTKRVTTRIPPLGVVGLSRSTVISVVIERSLVRFWERRTSEFFFADSHTTYSTAS